MRKSRGASSRMIPKHHNWSWAQQAMLAASLVVCLQSASYNVAAEGVVDSGDAPDLHQNRDHVEDVRRSLFATEEEEAQWIENHLEENHQVITRKLRTDKTVDIVIHWDKDHAENAKQFAFTNAETRTVTEKEYLHLRKNMAKMGILVLEYDHEVFDQTFVAGVSSSVASGEDYTQIDRKQITPWGVDMVLGKWEDMDPFKTKSKVKPCLCIVDTGINLAHHDLSIGDIVGKDFVTGDNWDYTTASNWHGPHMAGIACADSKNKVGIRGVLKDCEKDFKLLIAKTFQGPSTKMSLVEEGVEWCAAEGADVISLSLASQAPSFNSLMIFRHIKKSGKAIVLAAVGNGGPKASRAFPASYPDVIAVGAIDKQRRVADFSQLNPDIVAPGVSIISHSAERSVSVEDFVGQATPMVFTASLDRSISAPLCDCGQKSEPCVCPVPSICVVQRNRDPVTTQAKITELSGQCLGMILWSEDDRNMYGHDLDFKYISSIPAFQVASAKAAALLQQGGVVTMENGRDVFRYADGTSQAVPFVASTMMELKRTRPDCTNDQVADAVLNTATSLGPAVYTGRGVVNMKDAYGALLRQPGPCGDFDEYQSYVFQSSEKRGESIDDRNPSAGLKLSRNSGRPRGRPGNVRGL